MKITSLLENTAEGESVKAEHGLSLYIETARHNILFDMGQTDLFAQNAEALGVDLSRIDIAVLSHGHYDHGGGLKRFLEINDHAPIYVQKDAFLPHYNGTEKYIGLDPALRAHPRIRFTEDRCRIDDSLSLYTCNEIEDFSAFDSAGLTEKAGDRFLPDDFRHEQYLLIEEEGRRVLISGCSHKGILSIAAHFTPNVLIGGFHFSKMALDGRLAEAALKLASLPTDFYTCHCTGREQYEFMKQYMPRLRYLSCGQSLNIRKEKTMSITKEQIMSVKGRGFLRNRGTDCFSGRVVTVAGLFTPDELRGIAACAEKFGNGKVIFTARLAAEIVGIPYNKIPEAEAFMAERGLAFGGTGAKVRPITACKGTTCIYGNIDTQALAKVLYDTFYIGMREVKLPHKFKIGVGGCPNSCMKPSLNDVGVEGCRAFSFDEALCRGCKKCAVAEGCPSKAVSFKEGKAMIDQSRCTGCGVCVGKCPFGAVPKEADGVCRLFVGGTWGKTRRMGTPLSAVYTVEEIPTVIEKVMLWYKENGYVKERLGATVDRLGIGALEAEIAGDGLLQRKEEILAMPLREQ